MSVNVNSLEFLLDHIKNLIVGKIHTLFKYIAEIVIIKKMFLIQ